MEKTGEIMEEANAIEKLERNTLLLSLRDDNTHWFYRVVWQSSGTINGKWKLKGNPILFPKKRNIYYNFFSVTAEDKVMSEVHEITVEDGLLKTFGMDGGNVNLMVAFPVHADQLKNKDAMSFLAELIGKMWTTQSFLNNAKKQNEIKDKKLKQETYLEREELKLLLEQFGLTNGKKEVQHEHTEQNI